MARKTIPPDTQKNVLLKSRRRCCLCYWLDGKDENQKGQIAHLDGNNENADEDNLVFLCFDHHDEFDGTTRLAKGLQIEEVRHWRNELYKEMEYRFRSVRKRALELTIDTPLFSVDQERQEVVLSAGFHFRFKLKNVGESDVRTPVVSLELPPDVAPQPEESYDMGRFNIKVKVPPIGGLQKVQEDFFEPNGSVAQVHPVGGLNPILMPGHSATFDGMVFQFEHFVGKTELRMRYRIDAEEMTPVVGELVYQLDETLLSFVSALSSKKQV